MIRMKKLNPAVVIVLLLSAGVFKSATAQEKFSKAEFYTIMATGGTDAIDNELTVVDEGSAVIKDGYEGALLMKKASLVSRPKKKLDLFKEGRIELEKCIADNIDDTELRFLRLAVEEHAPKIVKYHNDIEKDKLIVQKNFRNLSPVVQHAILDYTKNSKVLHAEDL
jgi:hypothetical protein